MAGWSIYGAKPAFRRSLDPIARRLGRVHPDAISAAAVGFAALAAGLLAYAPGKPFLYLGVPPLLGLRIACNALDGLVAQQAGRATKRGAITNEVSDRVSDLVIGRRSGRSSPARSSRRRCAARPSCVCSACPRSRCPTSATTSPPSSSASTT